MESMFINNTMIAATTEVVNSEKDMQINIANDEMSTTVEGEASLEEVVEDIAAEDGVAVEGETGSDEGDAVIDEGVTDTASDLEGDIIIDDGKPAYDEGGMEEGINVDPTSGMGVTDVKNPLLSSWLFVISISIAVLCVSVVTGVLLARRKIKKGIELYED